MMLGGLRHFGCAKTKESPFDIVIIVMIPRLSAKFKQNFLDMVAICDSILARIRAAGMTARSGAPPLVH
jgi:hypothetical protein